MERRDSSHSLAQSSIGTAHGGRFHSKWVIIAWLNREGLTTTAIEGEMLDPFMVRSSLARRLQLPPQPGQPQPSARVEGLVDLLMAATAQLSAPLTGGAPSLRSIPTGVLRSGTTPMQVVSGAIGREQVHFEAPPSHGLPRMLVAFLHWFNSPPQGLRPLLRPGVAHLWFVTLHPYEDGNGRLGRALAERVLAQDSLGDHPLAALVPGAGEGCRTVRKAVGLTRVSRATAYRDLSDLVEKGALSPCGRGRSEAYRLTRHGA